MSAERKEKRPILSMQKGNDEFVFWIWWFLAANWGELNLNQFSLIRSFTEHQATEKSFIWLWPQNLFSWISESCSIKFVGGRKKVYQSQSLQVRWQRALPSTELQFTMIVIMHQNVSLYQMYKWTTARSNLQHALHEERLHSSSLFCPLKLCFVIRIPSVDLAFPQSTEVRKALFCLLCSVSTSLRGAELSGGDIRAAAQKLSLYKISPILVYHLSSL